jgi:hypothetical protein
LRAHAAKRSRKVGSLPALQQHYNDQEDANHYMNNRYQN